MPHYTVDYKPLLQAAPLNIYDMGKHTVVLSGSEHFLILEEDLILE